MALLLWQADIPTTLQAALGSQVCSTLSGRVDVSAM